jgi:hypothetical protein
VIGIAVLLRVFSVELCGKCQVRVDLQRQCFIE